MHGEPGEPSLPPASASTLDGRVPSPCIGVCRLDDRRGCCIGCGRTVAEIAGWRDYTDAQRRAVWQRLAQR